MVLQDEVLPVRLVHQGLDDLVEPQEHQVLRDLHLAPPKQALCHLGQRPLEDGDDLQQQEYRSHRPGHQPAGLRDVPPPGGTFPERQFLRHLLRGVLVGEQLVQALDGFAAEEGHQQPERELRAG